MLHLACFLISSVIIAAHLIEAEPDTTCSHAGKCPAQRKVSGGSHGSLLLQSHVASSKQPPRSEPQVVTDDGNDARVPELLESRRNARRNGQPEARNLTSLLDLDKSLPNKQSSWNWGSRDYDCDGDGDVECGQWDWGSMSCKNAPTCGHDFKPGDHLMEHSCRCMRCFDEPDTAAAKTPRDGAMKHYVYGRWRGWNRLLDTCAPWLMPKSDDDLRAILKYAKENRYTVRPSGATHSSGALVTDWMDKNVLAVSLAEYRAPDEWEFSLNEQQKGTATVTVNAGWSPLQLYQKIRPLNYFLPTQTAGPVFQLGGLVSNCVHGGNYQRGFLHQYVVKMRVMLHNGTQQVISDPAELRFWRNSYGLLGIITSLEFSLDYRPQFQSYAVKRKVSWNEDAFWTFLKQDAHADLSQEVAPSGHAGDRKALMGQFFLNPYEASEGQATIAAVVWRANENATEPGISSAVPWDVHGGYARKINERVIDEVIREYSVEGKVKDPLVSSEYGEVIKHWGGPKVFPLGLNVNDVLAPNARMMTGLALGGPETLLNDNRHQMNDGFFANKVPNVVYAAYFIDPKLVWKAMNVLVASFAARKDDPVFAWNGPPELRFMTVTDDAVLNPVPPGVWAISEFMGFPTGKSDQGWKSAFKSIQDEWEDQLGGKPHLGKFWGFGVDAKGTVEPFQPERACRIYSDAQKTMFEEYRQRVDPENLFAGGDAMKLLQRCA